ncbi:hypothetical protein NKR23_g11782 [Pleurostoma richardsiae]|uniref:Tetratricopeptide repeat protein n=1 Tax=Pleurostoma richardsiae TaxID=41990 RepID=A0AA38RB55_9PEZI|nr:hypothetical protein NKR23_g11782 [Pleurostoma richardsiae]
MFKNDPLLLNEMGIVYYHHDRPKDAITMFRRALEVVEDTEADAEALGEFDLALRDGGRDAAIFCAKSPICLELRRSEDAIEATAASIPPVLDEGADLGEFEMARDRAKVSARAKLEAKTRPPGRAGGSSYRGRGKGKERAGTGREKDERVMETTDED